MRCIDCGGKLEWLETRHEFGSSSPGVVRKVCEARCGGENSFEVLLTTCCGEDTKGGRFCPDCGEEVDL